MKTNLLLESIGVVAILILLSFTAVNGIKSITADSLDESPLFSMRTQKAINQSDLVLDAIAGNYNRNIIFSHVAIYGLHSSVTLNDHLRFHGLQEMMVSHKGLISSGVML